MSDSELWLAAQAAQSRLGVARQTLYAYVSRGLLRTCPAPDDPRRSLYSRFDLDRLLERRRRGRARRDVAASAIDFGEPVLVSRITRISGARLWYRGEDALRLAGSATLEQVAALLWQVSALPELPPSDYAPGKTGPAILRCVGHIAQQAGSGIWARSTSTLANDAALLLRQTAEAAGDARADGPVHLVLARAWAVGAAEADLLRRALVLCADHELNASTFAVRVVASTGAPLAACLLAGLAALSGPLHGGATDRVRAFLAEPGLLADPAAGVAARLARGERVPGVGHRLYPEGDPRAQALLAAFDPGRRQRALLKAIAEITGLYPNIDMALVLLERRVRLPIGSALAIFAAGRTAGWVAHALEQRQDGRLIRPRASYAGPAEGLPPVPTEPV